MSSEK